MRQNFNADPTGVINDTPGVGNAVGVPGTQRNVGGLPEQLGSGRGVGRWGSVRWGQP